jgi:hypothetical protein
MRNGGNSREGCCGFIFSEAKVNFTIINVLLNHSYGVLHPLPIERCVIVACGDVEAFALNLPIFLDRIRKDDLQVSLCGFELNRALRCFSGLGFGVHNRVLQ